MFTYAEQHEIDESELNESENEVDYEVYDDYYYDESDDLEQPSTTLTTIRTTRVQTMKTIISKQSNFAEIPQSNCRDKKIWCSLADCRLNNVKRNCPMTCNICS